jgi:hypothetical protein
MWGEQSPTGIFHRGNNHLAVIDGGVTTRPTLFIVLHQVLWLTCRHPAPEVVQATGITVTFYTMPYHKQPTHFFIVSMMIMINKFFNPHGNDHSFPRACLNLLIKEHAVNKKISLHPFILINSYIMFPCSSSCSQQWRTTTEPESRDKSLLSATEQSPESIFTFIPPTPNTQQPVPTSAGRTNTPLITPTTTTNDDVPICQHIPPTTCTIITPTSSSSRTDF